MRDPYAWLDPFEAVEAMEDYFREREDELNSRLRWALHETARARSLADAALIAALQKYAPVALERVSATVLMDTEVARLILGDRP